MAENKAVLRIPTAERVRYKRNFIKTAVCELRFPTLLSLETEPPRAFQASVRKQYPFYERQVDLDLGPSSVEGAPRYLFKSKDQNWTVAVRSFSIALETSKYVDFEDFQARFSKVLESARPMIDADFFTRIGLRYINWIPIEDDTPRGWIRDELLPPIGEVLGDVDKFAVGIQGYLPEDGQYGLRLSLKRDNEPMPYRFVLDTDLFKENVEFGDVLRHVEEFNSTNFSLFSWSLGPKARELLGEGKPK